MNIMREKKIKHLDLKEVSATETVFIQEDGIKIECADVQGIKQR